MKKYIVKKRIRTWDSIIKKGEQVTLSGTEQQRAHQALFGHLNFQTEDGRIVTLNAETMGQFLEEPAED